MLVPLLATTPVFETPSLPSTVSPEADARIFFHEPEPNLETLQRGYTHGPEVFRPAKAVVNTLNHAEIARHAG